MIQLLLESFYNGSKKAISMESSNLKNFKMRERFNKTIRIQLVEKGTILQI